MKFIYTLFFLIIFSVSDELKALELNPTVTKIQAMLAKPETLCGNFEQTKQLIGIKKSLRSSGRFCVVNGKGVLWRTLQPFPNTLRLTKNEIVHYQGDRESMRLEAKQEPTVRIINNVLFSLLSGDLTQLDSLFLVDGNVDAQGWTVKLNARQSSLEKAIGKITLNGNAYVKNIQIDEASGDKTVIVFLNIKTGDAAITVEELKLL